MMTRVKICGITSTEDALAAVEAGADALGFVFAESPRRVDVKTVQGLVVKLPPFVATVGVFAGQDEGQVLQAMDDTGLHYAQIHGDSAVSGEAVCWGVIRALRIQSAEDIHKAAQDPLLHACWAVLLDAHVDGLMGGTGQTFDWDLAVQAKSLGKPIILAGGLTPENVGEAVTKVRPYAVDVSTGVEASPGKKDYAKIKEFIDNAKRYE